MNRLLILPMLLLTATLTFAQEGMTKEQWDAAIRNKAYEKTEVWSPVPPKVTPAKNFGDAPSDAVILFDGTNAAAFQHADETAAKWTVANGVLTVKPSSGDLYSKAGFGSVQLHIEWKSPIDTVGKRGQFRGNSGVFLMGKYEVQILDNFDNRTYSNGQAGAVYKQHIPQANAARPTGEWQVYDIFFTAPKFAESGELQSPAYLTVLHNGILIQNHVEVKGETYFISPPQYEAHPDRLPLRLQDHGDLVNFRNIWVRPIAE